MARFQINPGADGGASFEMIGDGGEGSVKADLSAEEMQGLVDLLSAVRMFSPGSVTEEPVQGEVRAVVDPGWRAPTYRVPEGRVLILRHPGLGWLHFIFPEDKAQKLAALLTADLEGAPPAAAQSTAH